MNSTKLCCINTFKFLFIFSVFFLFHHPSVSAEGNLVYLADTETGDPIEFFDFGKASLNLMTLPESITFVAFTYSDDVNSIIFYIDGVRVKKENMAPFALAGDQNGHLLPYDFQTGSFTLTVKQFSESNGKGEIIFEEDIEVCVVDLIRPTLEINASQTVFKVAAGEQKDFMLHIDMQNTQDAYSLEMSEFADLPDWFSFKNNLQIGVNPFKVDASNLVPGEYYVSLAFDSKLSTNPCYFISGSNSIKIVVEPSSNMFVSGFQMVDSEQDQNACNLPEDFFNFLGNVFTYDWYCLPDSFSLVTETYGIVGSVVIAYSYTAPGQVEQPLKYHRTESIAPFTLFGDSKGDYEGIPKKSGLYKIRATPYAEKDGKGEAGNAFELTFVILNNLEISLNKEKIIVEVPAGEKVIFPFKVMVDGSEPDYEVNLDYLPGIHYVSLDGSFQEGNNQLIVDASNILPGTVNSSMGISVSPTDDTYDTYIRDNKIIPVEIVILPSNNLFVHRFEIGDSDSDQRFYGVSGGDLGDFAWNTLPENIFINALTSGETGSVVFEYAFTAPGEADNDLSFFKRENLAPYSLLGDDPRKDDFYGFAKKPGRYKIRAIPYSLSGGKGKQGNALEIQFNVLADPNALIEDMISSSQEDFQVYPNPIKHKANILYQPTIEGAVQVEIYDLQGALVKRIYQGYVSSDTPLSLELDRTSLHEGIYFCKITNSEGVSIKRVIVEN